MTVQSRTGRIHAIYCCQLERVKSDEDKSADDKAEIYRHASRGTTARILEYWEFLQHLLHIPSYRLSLSIEIITCVFEALDCISALSNILDFLKLTLIMNYS